MKTIDFYWLFGPFDGVWIVETDDVGNLARKMAELQDYFETTTMPALSFDTLVP